MIVKNKQLVLVLMFTLVFLGAIYIIFNLKSSIIKVTKTIPAVSVTAPLSKWASYQDQKIGFNLNYPPEWAYNVEVATNPLVLSKITFQPKDEKTARLNAIHFSVHKRNNAVSLEEWLNSNFIPTDKQIDEAKVTNAPVYKPDSITHKNVADKDAVLVTTSYPFPPNSKINLYSWMSSQYVFTLMFADGYAPGVAENILQSIKLINP